MNHRSDTWQARRLPNRRACSGPLNPGHRCLRTSLGALALALWFGLFAVSAFAGGPTHLHRGALDIAGLNHACGTAVDSKGDIYASSAGESKIEVFDSEHHPLMSIPDASQPCGLAVNSKGELFVSEKALGRVVRYRPDAYPFIGSPIYGTAEPIDTSGNAQGISIDRFDDRLYVAEGTRISTYNTDGTLGENELQMVRIRSSATGGTFALSFEGQTTVPIAFDAPGKTSEGPGSVEAALEALSSIGLGGVSVELVHPPPEEGSGSNYLITFTGPLASTDVPLLASNASNLEGEAEVPVSELIKGFNGHIGEGSLTGATGVAAYTYPIRAEESTAYLFVADASTSELKVFSGPDLRALKLRRVISGVDQDADPATEEQKFGFGSGGSYLAADSGNRNGEDKCSSIGAQACTAGHFFFYDAGHSAVDEFDATGEFVDQLTNPAFDDAQPTAIAVERSGGANDGMVYVTAGSAGGAKILSFGPLVTPARSALPELSHVRTGARAVAVDSNGDVYVAAEAKIYVYDSSGNELVSFEDPAKPYDLAVDSEGNLYVLDGPALEEVLTYYTPAHYPPSPGTSYTRHAPSLLAPQPNIGRIAVNPANDHLFVGRGFLGFSEPENNRIQEFGSAKEGSPLNPVFAPFFQFFNDPTGVDVHGGTGNVYAAGNQPDFDVVNASEIVSTVTGAGCPSGKLGVSQAIAVDQASGHALGFTPGQAGSAAREYDGAGSCVVEFGTFTGNGEKYDIAVDSSCAIHRNALGKPEPLTESTSPTCKQFDPANGVAYVAYDGPDNSVQPYDLSAFAPLSYGETPNTVTGGATGLGAGSATLHGTVDPRGFEVQECHFLFLSDTQYITNKKTFAGASSEECAESTGEIGTGTGAVAVHADLSGLDPQVRYRFLLVAKNLYGESGDGDEPGLFGQPVIGAKSALPVLYDEATLRGEVDPSGVATKYHFDYGPGEAYGQSTASVELAPGDGPVAVQAPLIGLVEGQEYHFRLVAENEAGEVSGPDRMFITLSRRPVESCPNAEFRTGPSSRLPGCRAYELVTPAETRGLEPGALPPGSAGKIFNNWLVAPRGERAGESLAYFAGTLPGFEGSGDSDGYRAERGPGAHPGGGWANELIAPTYAQLGGGSGNNQEGVASDQLYSLWTVSPVENFNGTLPRGHYLRTPSGFELVGQGGQGVDPEAESRFISAGGHHVVFSSKAHLEEDAAPAGTLAIYDRAAGVAGAEVVSIKVDGSPFGVGENAEYVGASENGSAIVFKVAGVLYLHRAGQSVEVANAPNTFAGISEDGKRVFYVDAAGSENQPPPAGINACDVEAGSCAGPDATHSAIEIAEKSIVVNVSPDGSRVFFTSEEVIGGVEPNENCEEAGGEVHCEEAESGAHNLYEWNGSEYRFIAILDPKDFKSFGGSDGFSGQGEENMLDWTRAINPGQHVGRGNSPTRSSPESGVFVFQSHAQLTAYDNEGHGEIYRYAPAAAPGERLICASCDPSRSPASADAMLQVYGGAAGGSTQPTTLITNITDDGQEIFFNSPDPLLPEDANSAIDVYEWDANGVEGCKRPDGCLALISTGQGEEPSTLYGMSADGRDVFFRTSEKLVGQDIAGSSSIYDARVEGGIPDPPVKEECRGDACQGAGSVPSSLPSPASATVRGNGNVTEESKFHCSKGQRRVRRNGKSHCVRVHRGKRHHRGRQTNRNRGAGR